jgi:hypothetical protein
MPRQERQFSGSQGTRPSSSRASKERPPGGGAGFYSRGGKGCQTNEGPGKAKERDQEAGTRPGKQGFGFRRRTEAGFFFLGPAPKPRWAARSARSAGVSTAGRRSEAGIRVPWQDGSWVSFFGPGASPRWAVRSARSAGVSTAGRSHSRVVSPAPLPAPHSRSRLVVRGRLSAVSPLLDRRILAPPPESLRRRARGFPPPEEVREEGKREREERPFRHGPMRGFPLRSRREVHRRRGCGICGKRRRRFPRSRGNRGAISAAPADSIACGFGLVQAPASYLSVTSPTARPRKTARSER